MRNATELWTLPLAGGQVLARARERARRCPDRRNAT